MKIEYASEIDFHCIHYNDKHIAKELTKTKIKEKEILIVKLLVGQDIIPDELCIKITKKSFLYRILPARPNIINLRKLDLVFQFIKFPYLCA
jgi:hypothetical protein